MLSVVGLTVAGLATYALIRNPIPIAAKAEPTTSAGIVVHIDPKTTAAPSNVVIANTKVTVDGSLVYAKSGNLFVQSGTNVVQITHSKDGSEASQPAWSRDGQWIYYIDTRITSGTWINPNSGIYSPYRLTYPVLCRVHADGTGQKDVLSGLIASGKLRTFFWLRHPSISPDGLTAALISDGPTQPGVRDNLLSFVSISNGKFVATPDLPDTHPFGHSEPVYSPDGKSIAYVVEGRNGSEGAPSVWLYDIATRKTSLVARGYRGPAWSPDGKYLAVAKVSGVKLDVFILNASTGARAGQITSDGHSWAPVWSPAGDRLVYMHLTGSVVDLFITSVTQDGSGLTFGSAVPLTEYSGLDGSSPAAWYIPSSATPNSPAPSPRASAGETTSASPSAPPASARP